MSVDTTKDAVVPRLPVSLGCYPYDRLEALRLGELQPEGIELYFTGAPESRILFARMTKHAAYDVAEMAGMYFLGRRAQTVDDRSAYPFVGLPVFPSRRFRHGCVFVNADAGITAPKDLEGKRVGVQQYRNTASIWVRGILQDDHGLDLDAVEWHQGGLNAPSSDAELSGTRLDFQMHRPVEPTPIPADRTLSDMLASGELDAVISPRVPNSLGSATVRRLWENYPELERDYYRRTGMFPIMHVLVMREELHEQHPWVAQSLYDAMVESKRRAIALLHRSGAAKTMLPWQLEAVEEADEIFGDSFWPYGLERNRENLETLMRYLVEQGFLERAVDIDGLFAPIVETSH